METPLAAYSRDVSPRPNFPAFRHEGFALEIGDGTSFPKEFLLHPLRALSGSGRPLPFWELHCRGSSGTLAGGCAVVLPREAKAASSPRHFPHPVLGEWISALRYTGLNWLECGPVAVAPGFPEEGVLQALWEGLTRLMERNGVSFLIGTAAPGSHAQETAVRRGARMLEPYAAGAVRYFIYVG